MSTYLYDDGDDKSQENKVGETVHESSYVHTAKHFTAASADIYTELLYFPQSNQDLPDSVIKNLYTNTYMQCIKTRIRGR
jgi:hypothetical protein